MSSFDESDSNDTNNTYDTADNIYNDDFDVPVEDENINNDSLTAKVAEILN